MQCVYCVPINGQHAPGCPVLRRGGGVCPPDSVAITVETRSPEHGR